MSSSKPERVQKAVEKLQKAYPSAASKVSGHAFDLGTEATLEDNIKYGTASHYYNFYQHETDGAPYSSYYKKDTLGFVTYFWGDLVNLNYNNDEVQRWMIEACKYWIKKFGIDG